RIDQGAQPSVYLRHRLWLVRPSGGIPRSPCPAEAVPAGNTGPHDRHRAEERDGVGAACRRPATQRLSSARLDRAIEYPEAAETDRGAAAYGIPAFSGLTLRVTSASRSAPRKT